MTKCPLEMLASVLWLASVDEIGRVTGTRFGWACKPAAHDKQVRGDIEVCMTVPYGAIFDQPEAGSPAATAGIEQGDVLTTINGSPLMNSTDFAKIISQTAPGTTVYLSTVRNGERMPIKLIIGSAPCRTSG